MEGKEVEKSIRIQGVEERREGDLRHDDQILQLSAHYEFFSQLRSVYGWALYHNSTVILVHKSHTCRSFKGGKGSSEQRA